MENFDKVLKEKTEHVEEIIYSYCPKEEKSRETIFEAVDYSIKAGGKRIRPLLMLETTLLFGGDERDAYPFMAAIEMIHTYSLVHDDLPAMDNDTYRRGKETTHAKYGEAFGVLAGDALLNLSYEVMADAVAHEKNTEAASRAMRIIAKKAGMSGMIGGQAEDIENEGKDVDLKMLDHINSLKTSALIEASMTAGAVLAGAGGVAVRKIGTAAGYIGAAFQIRDDILDVAGKSEILGKSVQNDKKNNKSTYATILGADKAEKLVEEYSKKALDIISTFGGDGTFLEELVLKLAHREK